MALPRQNLIPRQNFSPTPKPPTPQHTTRIYAFARQGPTPNLPLGATREDIVSCAIFVFFRPYWTVCINHRPHAKKKGPAWRPRQNQGPHAGIYDSTPELTISTPESRPPRQNFNLHADAPRQNLARQNVWQGDCGKECPTPEFTEATQRLFQHVVAWRLQLCCTEPAYGPVTTLHRACNHVAQDA